MDSARPVGDVAMKIRSGRRAYVSWLCGSVVVLCAIGAWAQSNSAQKNFPQSKPVIEKALKAMQGNMAGHLPVLEGFATPAERPLDRYQRGYYQASAEVTANPSGGSTVRMKVKVTAWLSDPSSPHSGYQLLTSNGRLESDLLDQLSEQLSRTTPEKAETRAVAANPTPNAVQGEQPSTPEPARKFPENNGSISSSMRDWASSSPAPEKSADTSAKPDPSLKAEADSLEEILKSTSHPKNLVAIKKSGTPVVSTPSLTAKPQFLASMHDEFELLDFN